MGLEIIKGLSLDLRLPTEKTYAADGELETDVIEFFDRFENTATFLLTIGKSSVVVTYTLHPPVRLTAILS